MEEDKKSMEVGPSTSHCATHPNRDQGEPDVFTVVITEKPEEPLSIAVEKLILTKTEASVKKDRKQAIVRKRQLFEAVLLRRQGPAIIPTLFKNHPERHKFVRQREKLLAHERNPRNPPPEPYTKFSFPDDIYFNIFTNFEKENCRRFIKPALVAKMVFLNKEFCGEEAFKELLSREPYFYSSDRDRLKLSQYVDTDFSHWVAPSGPCQNCCEFVVDFSMIFPEGIASTALVMCYDCGKMVETVLRDKALELAKTEMWHNICNPEVVFDDSNPVHSVIRLPPRGTIVDTLSLVEGLMGVTTLTKSNPDKPSVFVRTRLYCFVNARSNFSSIIHDSTEDTEEGVFPTHEEYMQKFNIH